MSKHQEVIILDQSDDECIQKGEPNINVCLRDQGVEVKEQEQRESKQEEIRDACRGNQEIIDKEWVFKRITSPEESVANCTNNDSENGILLKDAAILPRVKVKAPDTGCSQNSTTVRDDVREKETQIEVTTFHSISMVSQRRKKRMIDKNTLPFVVLNEKCKEPVIVAEKAILSKMVEPKPRMWDIGLSCDLCRRGPSLLMGEWYSWCCGSRLHYCNCSSALKLYVSINSVVIIFSLRFEM